MSWVERHQGERGIARFSTADWQRYGLKRGCGAWLVQWFARNGLALLCLSIGIGGHPAGAQETDFAIFARAAEYCRGDMARPMALSSDKRMLCLDGVIASDLDFSVAADLADRSIAIVRSRGGDPARAVQLANVLRDRNAVVVVRDFCLFACASFILLASTETYVLDQALVAWGAIQRFPDHDCIGFIEREDQAGPFLTSMTCLRTNFDEEPEWRRWTEFYRDRIAGPAFTDPPESKFIRRTLMNLYRSTGQYPVVLWTWNPRHHASAIKTRIVYQHYPDSQEEVDEIAKRLGLIYRVIYDP